MKKFYPILITMILFSSQCGYVNSNNFSHKNKNNADISDENTTSTIPSYYDDNGIFSSCYEMAYKSLKTMSLEEKIGQLFLARCPAEGAIDVIKKYKIGGFVLFRRDFQDKSFHEVADTLSSYQKASNIPLILSTDEEGGTVVRISNNENLSKHRFLSPQELFKLGGMEKIKNDAIEKAKLLKSLGINVNLAPVADVSENPDDFIYNRSFGKNAEETKYFIKTVVTITQSNGVSSCLKHFPGYGNNIDTHTDVAIDERPFESFLKNDFKPFEEGIKNGVHCILVSHNIVKCMDDTLPSSLSPNVHRILREDLGFTGIIITDDLVMDAIKLHTSSENPAIQAILAGNDMMIVTDIAEAYSKVLLACLDGKISETQIDKACFRVLAFKYYIGKL